ncbi:MAG TPA: signal peptidase II [Coriobacteriia bacterium]|nr:signal peptidase II [Coriobacteriia bacterium]
MTRRVAVRFALIVALVMAADQATKAAVRAGLQVGESVPLVHGILDLTHVSNAGAAFGLLPGRVPFFIVMATVVLVAILWIVWRYGARSRLFATALALVFGGAAGNLIDRTIAGRVTDFIDVQIWPVFNVADIALDVGVALLILSIVLNKDEPHAVDPAEPGLES